MAFLSDASETRPEAACRLSNRDSHPNTSFSSEDGWRGPCFARTVTGGFVCYKLWLEQAMASSIISGARSSAFGDTQPGYAAAAARPAKNAAPDASTRPNSNKLP
ncbi:MAG: hypothetical protein IPO18_06355 [bacterium]|nr:hypothetical protein [bacterium]